MLLKAWIYSFLPQSSNLLSDAWGENSVMFNGINVDYWCIQLISLIGEYIHSHLTYSVTPEFISLIIPLLSNTFWSPLTSSPPPGRSLFPSTHLQPPPSQMLLPTPFLHSSQTQIWFRSWFLPEHRVRHFYDSIMEGALWLYLLWAPSVFSLIPPTGVTLPRTMKLSRLFWNEEASTDIRIPRLSWLYS